MKMIEFEYKTSHRDGVEIRHSVQSSDSDYATVANEFLIKLFREFALLSIKAYRPRIGAMNMPYMYSERRLDSVVLPALSKLCNGLVLTELPVVRKKSKRKVKSEHGRVDYWCIFKGYTFVVEMKGSHDRFDCETVRENSVVKRWGKMIEQLNDIEEECRNREEKTKGMIRLGLHFLSSWANKVVEPRLVDEYRDLCEGNMNVICDEIASRCKVPNSEPSFAATWIIPDEMVYWDNATYPGVMLIAKIYED